MPGSPRDRAVGATIRALARDEALPDASDTPATFGPGHAFARRVVRENLWLWFRFDETHVHLLAVRSEPPVLAGE